MIKVWPVHRHNWETAALIRCGCSHHRIDQYANVAVVCYCGKAKKKKIVSGGTCLTKDSVEKILNKRGWDYCAEVQHAR